MNLTNSRYRSGYCVLDEAHCKWYILINNYKHSSDISFKDNGKLKGNCEICRERRWVQMLRIEARILHITFPLFLKEVFHLHCFFILFILTWSYPSVLFIKAVRHNLPQTLPALGVDSTNMLFIYYFEVFKFLSGGEKNQRVYSHRGMLRFLSVC